MSRQKSLYWLFILVLQQLHVNATCKYALHGINYRPIKMDECSDLSWGSIVHSMSRHCYKNGGNLTYKLYYEEKCPSDESKWHDQDSSIPCYIDTSIKKCHSFEMQTYMMTYDPSISNEYYRPPISNDSWEPDSNPPETCYYDSSGEHYGNHPIYDACLANPRSTQYPFVKGEYFKGAFETNCSYTIHYYSDKECSNRIHSSYEYNEECREGTDRIPYSYDFPDCPWRPNTVWIIVFCVFGCCYFGCFCCYFLDKDHRGKSCPCLYEQRETHSRYRSSRKYYARKEGCCFWFLCDYYDKKKREREERRRQRRREEQRIQTEQRRKEEEERKKAEQDAEDDIEAQKRRNRAQLKEEQRREMQYNTKRNVSEKVTLEHVKKKHFETDNNVIDRKGTLSYSAAQCVICLDALLENEEMRLNCGHKFHTHCIEEYNETKSECPLCRKQIVFQ